VDAVQVSEENFEVIAGWCGGVIKETMSLRNRMVKFIHVPVTRPQTERQEQARVGDWILTSERGYKVYTPKAFSVAFDKVNEVRLQSYPYPDGNVTVLGPEVFTGTDKDTGNSHTADPSTHDTISWKGENYYTLERASALVNTPIAYSEEPAFDNTIAQDERVARRRVKEADIRNQAAFGKIKAEEAEMQINRLPAVDVQPVGTLPMPKQNLGDVGLPESAVASPPTETPKAADVWARAERGEITGEQARAILGQPVIAAAAVPVAAPITEVEVSPPVPAVGTQPMPEQPTPSDVEVRERPPALPPHMQPSETDVVTHTNAEVAELKAEQGIPTIEHNATEGGTQHMSTPEDPNTHVGVDVDEDEALKASIDITDENVLKAADEDEQLAADAMRED